MPSPPRKRQQAETLSTPARLGVGEIVFQSLPDARDGSGPHRYTLSHTLLGDAVLLWSATWLAGLFCLVELGVQWPEREGVVVAGRMGRGRPAPHAAESGAVEGLMYAAPPLILAPAEPHLLLPGRAGDST